MWWEMIPSLVIITMIGYIPFVVFGPVHRLEIRSLHLRYSRKDINKNMYVMNKWHDCSSFISRRIYLVVTQGSPYFYYSFEKLTDKE